MLECPKCHSKTKVIETRDDGFDYSRILRTRQCKSCNRKFETVETISREIYSQGVKNK